MNKNATADKAIRELREQLVRLSPHGGAVSDATLARATAFLNSTIRHTGRSAKELSTPPGILIIKSIGRFIYDSDEASEIEEVDNEKDEEKTNPLGIFLE